MPAPSQLAIATSSVQRLAKEEASYHKELQMQQQSIDQLEKKSPVEETDEDRGNHAFQLKQEVRRPRLTLWFSIPIWLCPRPAKSPLSLL
jgi:tubulin-specific chaperone A